MTGETVRGMAGYPKEETLRSLTAGCQSNFPLRRRERERGGGGGGGGEWGGGITAMYFHTHGTWAQKSICVHLSPGSSCGLVAYTCEMASGRD